MRRILILFLLLSTTGLAQDTEFPVYENGLIYDGATMKRLRQIVDSMNIRFSSCEPQVYASHYQGFASKVRVTSGELRRQIRNGLSWSDFEKQYSHLAKARKCWITRLSGRDWEGEPFVSYRELPADDETGSIRLPHTPGNIKASGWVLSADGKEAWFLHELKSYPLPEKWGRLVQYVDCMIDTTTTIFLGQQDTDSRFSDTSGEVEAFLEMANDFPAQPAPPDWDELEEEEYRARSAIYLRQYHEWDSLRRVELRKRMESNPGYVQRLRKAMEIALSEGSSTDEFEEYVAEFISKEDALRLKRHRQVWGSCSMDLSPRYHAMNICVLAAQTTKWDIFLRSHLDIMNDNVHRVSDGSWAWEGRKTYLRELEALDIDAANLLIGTCLRVEGVGENHYDGSVSRVGRALAETSHPAEVESQLIAMILDDQLDLYNRLLVSYLFSNYMYSISDESRVAELKQRLSEAVAKTPEPIREAWRRSR